jgi:hypothetical protein
LRLCTVSIWSAIGISVKHTEAPRTMIKIVAKRQTRDLFALGGVILALFFTIAGIAGVQVLLCKQEHPRRTVLQCVAPLWNW